MEDDFIDESVTVLENEKDDGQTELTGEDYENIARVTSVDGITWYKIHGWGKATKKLESWQCGIALTLSGLAADNWIKKPSAKQARQGVKILRIAIPIITAGENED